MNDAVSLFTLLQRHMTDRLKLAKSTDPVIWCWIWVKLMH